MSKKKLFSMEMCLIEKGDDQIDSNDYVLINPDMEELGRNINMSMHAVTGEPAYETLKITGYVGNRPILILVDSGSSHNFLDAKLAKDLKCDTTKVSGFTVTVAYGNQVKGTEQRTNFTWKMQGKKFSADTMLLPLGEYDLILGAQWLESIKRITWDYEERTLQFEHEGKPFKMETTRKPNIKWITG